MVIPDAHMERVFMCLQQSKFIAIAVSREMWFFCFFYISVKVWFYCESHSGLLFPNGQNIKITALNSENVTCLKIEIIVKHNKHLPEFVLLLNLVSIKIPIWCKFYSLSKLKYFIGCRIS